jgi:hypothetical protein
MDRCRWITMYWAVDDGAEGADRLTCMPWPAAVHAASSGDGGPARLRASPYSGALSSNSLSSGTARRQHTLADALRATSAAATAATPAEFFTIWPFFEKKSRLDPWTT